MFCCFSYAAYDDKQQSKRKEISSRSWFNSTSVTPGGLLHKLGVQGKEAAVAKALGSPHSPLIRKRTGGPGITSEPSSTITSVKEERLSPVCHEGADAKDRVEITEELDEGLATTEKEQNRHRVPSLVADYSDSDSDPGQ